MRFLWKSRRSPLLRSLAALQEHVGSVRAGESSPHTVAAAFHLVMRLMINAWILIYKMRNFFFPRGSNMNNRVCRAYICIHDTWREVDVGLLVEWVTNYPPPHWDSCSDRKGGGEEHLARSVCWMFVLSEASYRIKRPPTVLTKPLWVTKRRRWTLVNVCILLSHYFCTHFDQETWPGVPMEPVEWWYEVTKNAAFFLPANHQNASRFYFDNSCSNYWQNQNQGCKFRILTFGLNPLPS